MALVTSACIVLQEADEQLAAAAAARESAEMRVEREQKVIEQLKLALELQRLTAQAAATNSTPSQSDGPTEPADNGPDNSVHRCDTPFN